MANNFGGVVKFNQNEAQEMVIHVLGTDPSTPASGQIWVNTAAGAGNWILKWNDNGTVRTIPHLVQVMALRLDQFAVPTADLNLNNRKITNQADPSADTDGATKGWVVSLFNGQRWKDAVRMATTANIALTGLQTIDGVSGAVDDRVLVKNQSTGTQNGLYLMKSGAWVRTLDADANAEVKSGLAVFVSEGGQGNTQWALTTDDPIVVGTTALSFGQTGASTTYTQGTGIIISGASIAIDTALVPRKFAVTYGDGVATQYTHSHNLGTKDLHVSFMKVSTNEPWDIPWNAPTNNSIQINHSIAPTSNEFRVTIIAAG